MKKILLISLFGLNVNINAQGIPTIDAAAIAQAVLSVQEAKNQVMELQKQYQQMQAQYRAITGSKGFVEAMKNAGIENDLFELLNGDYSDFEALAKKFFDFIPECKNEKFKEFCQSTVLHDVIAYEQTQKLNQEFDARLKRLENLSRRATQATDLKSSIEVQNAIALEQQATQLLAMQAQNLKEQERAKQEIYNRQKRQALGQQTMDAYFKKDSEENTLRVEDLFK